MMKQIIFTWSWSRSCWRSSLFRGSRCSWMRSNTDSARLTSMTSPILTGGAHWPRGICWQIGNWNRLDSSRQRISEILSEVKIDYLEDKMISLKVAISGAKDDIESWLTKKSLDEESLFTNKVPWQRKLPGKEHIALNKTFMEVDGIGQLSRFHCIINYGTQIVSLKKSQSAANIWNFPWAWKFTQNVS